MRPLFKVYIFLLINILLAEYTYSATRIRDPFILMNHFHAEKTTPPIEAWIPLYFIKAPSIIAFLSDKKNHLLSQYGHIHADKQTNQLWISDLRFNVKHIKSIIKHLDQRTAQFVIRARIAVVDRQYQKSLGIRFNTANALYDDKSSSTKNAPVISTNNDFTFAIAKLAESKLLNLQISALEQAGHATSISNPVLVTLNNETASIESGAEVPYQETNLNGGTSVNFKKAVLSLKVTPELLPNQHILLHIALTQDKVSNLTVKGVPAIETQQMKTQVITKNNQMIMLGGILENSNTKQQQSIPFFGHIPVIGMLFKHHHRQKERQVLLICITTSLIK